MLAPDPEPPAPLSAAPAPQDPAAVPQAPAVPAAGYPAAPAPAAALSDVALSASQAPPAGAVGLRVALVGGSGNLYRAQSRLYRSRCLQVRLSLGDCTGSIVSTTDCGVVRCLKKVYD